MTERLEPLIRTDSDRDALRMMLNGMDLEHERLSDEDFRDLLLQLAPSARDALRRILIHDQDDRDAVSSQLLRYRDGHGDDWADIIDLLTMHPEARRSRATARGARGRFRVWPHLITRTRESRIGSVPCRADLTQTL